MGQKENFNNSNNTIMENFSDWLLNRPNGVDCDFLEITNGVIYGTENEINFSISFKMPFDDNKPRKKDKK
tara:strand:- start:277 stop:486 length:210 start_codon:yes stop_codon:yes gene_type:complete